MACALRSSFGRWSGTGNDRGQSRLSVPIATHRPHSCSGSPRRCRIGGGHRCTPTSPVQPPRWRESWGNPMGSTHGGWLCRRDCLHRGAAPWGEGRGKPPCNASVAELARPRVTFPGGLPMTPTKPGVGRGGLRDHEPSGSPIASPAVAGPGRTQGEHWSDPSRPHPKRIDVIDRQILEILQHNSQATYDDIAARIRRSASTTRDRIRQMERSGIIRGYCAIIDAKAVGLGTGRYIGGGPRLL